jgi:hypothetical protein
MWIEPEVFEPVTDTLTRLGYEPFSPPGDRHGSWQWSFYRESGGMTRFVILAATPVESGRTLQVELWIGAEADQRFTRYRVESLRWDVEKLPQKTRTLIPSVEQAVARANALRWSDLEAEPQTLHRKAV